MIETCEAVEFSSDNMSVLLSMLSSLWKREIPKTILNLNLPDYRPS